jgi:hypothetical protein
VPWSPGSGSDEGLFATSRALIIAAKPCRAASLLLNRVAACSQMCACRCSSYLCRCLLSAALPLLHCFAEPFILLLNRVAACSAALASMRPVIVTGAAVLTGPAAVIPVVANDLVGGREGGGGTRIIYNRALLTACGSDAKPQGAPPRFGPADVLMRTICGSSKAIHIRSLVVNGFG